MNGKDFNNTPPALLTVTEVGKHLGVSVRTVWRLTSAGQLSAPVSIGRCRRWHRRDVDTFIETLHGSTNN